MYLYFIWSTFAEVLPLANVSSFTLAEVRTYISYSGTSLFCYTKMIHSTMGTMEIKETQVSREFQGIDVL